MYPIEDKIAVMVTSSHWTVWVYVSPLSQGYPSRRARVLAFIGSRRTLRWCGPTSPEDIQLDYDHRFGRPLILSGSIFFCESDSERWSLVCLFLSFAVRRAGRHVEKRQSKQASKQAIKRNISSKSKARIPACRSSTRPSPHGLRAAGSLSGRSHPVHGSCGHGAEVQRVAGFLFVAFRVSGLLLRLGPPPGIAGLGRGHELPSAAHSWPYPLLQWQPRGVAARHSQRTHVRERLSRRTICNATRVPVVWSRACARQPWARTPPTERAIRQRNEFSHAVELDVICDGECREDRSHGCGRILSTRRVVIACLRSRSVIALVLMLHRSRIICRLI